LNFAKSSIRLDHTICHGGKAVEQVDALSVLQRLPQRPQADREHGQSVEPVLEPFWFRVIVGLDIADDLQLDAYERCVTLQ
jgi:hypothetical protein